MNANLYIRASLCLVIQKILFAFVNKLHLHIIIRAKLYGCGYFVVVRLLIITEFIWKTIVD